MIVGTPGGSRIITAVLLTILNVIDFGMDIQEAVDAPRFHQQWLPEATIVERFALSPDTRRILVDMGHKFLRTAAGQSRRRDSDRGALPFAGKPIGKNRFYGAIDPRRNTGSGDGVLNECRHVERPSLLLKSLSSRKERKNRRSIVDQESQDPRLSR